MSGDILSDCLSRSFIQSLSAYPMAGRAVALHLLAHDLISGMGLIPLTLAELWASSGLTRAQFKKGLKEIGAGWDSHLPLVYLPLALRLFPKEKLADAAIAEMVWEFKRLPACPLRSEALAAFIALHGEYAASFAQWLDNPDPEPCREGDGANDLFMAASPKKRLSSKTRVSGTLPGSLKVTLPPELTGVDEPVIMPSGPGFELAAFVDMLRTALNPGLALPAKPAFASGMEQPQPDPANSRETAPNSAENEISECLPKSNEKIENEPVSQATRILWQEDKAEGVTSAELERLAGLQAGMRQSPESRQGAAPIGGLLFRELNKIQDNISLKNININNNKNIKSPMDPEINSKRLKANAAESLSAKSPSAKSHPAADIPAEPPSTVSPIHSAEDKTRAVARGDDSFLNGKKAVKPDGNQQVNHEVNHQVNHQANGQEPNGGHGKPDTAMFLEKLTGKLAPPGYFCALPLARGFACLPVSWLEEWRGRFKGVDINWQVGRMVAHLKANPPAAPEFANIRSYVEEWLMRCKDKRRSKDKMDNFPDISPDIAKVEYQSVNPNKAPKNPAPKAQGENWQARTPDDKMLDDMLRKLGYDPGQIRKVMWEALR